MSDPIRVMVEQGRRKVIVSAFDWPGWDRGTSSEEAALEILATYRPRYARVAELAGLADELAAAGELEVVERVPGTSTTDYHTVSAVAAAPEREPMTDAACERKIALLRASWAYFDDVASRVSAELRRGPRGGGRDRDGIIYHTNGAQIDQFGPKVGVRTPLEAWQDPAALRAHRDAVCAAIRDHHARGAAARSWPLQFLIRRCAGHMLDHAWEMEDRDLSGGA